MRSQTVLNCISSLNALGRKTQVHFRWIKAHVGHAGNELADDIAKRATKNVDSVHGPDPLIPVSPNQLKLHLQEAQDKLWNAAWSARTDCRQTKIWFPCIQRLWSAKLVAQSREEFSKAVQIITGHNFLNRHKHVIDPEEDACCRLCLEDDESSWHVVAECPALARTRLQVFGTHCLESPPNWSPNQLSQFLRERSVRLLLDWEAVEQ